MSGKYGKEIIATLIAFGAALATALGTSPEQNLAHLDTTDWLKVIVAFLGTGVVTAWVTNVGGVAGGIIKAVAATVGTFCTAIITAYVDQVVTQGELIGAVVAALMALAAVYEAPSDQLGIMARRRARRGVVG